MTELGPVPGVWDHVILFLMVVVLPVRAMYRFRQFRRNVESGDLGARTREYRRTMVWQWTVAALLIVYWLGSERPIEALGLGPPSGWSFGVGLAVAAALIAFLRSQQRLVERSPSTKTRVIAQLERLAILLPQTPAELRLFTGVAATAGVCEGVLFRGFFMWHLNALWGPVAAVLVSSLIFGAAHAYQGWRNGLRIVPLALILAALYLGTGSLWVPMFLHALVDFTQGRFAHRLLQSEEVGGAAATVTND